MREAVSYPSTSFKVTRERNGSSMLLPALALMAGALACLFLLFVDFDSRSFRIERPYLIPWVLATGLVIAAPSVYLIYKKEFSFAHPLVFAAFTYFLPSFFLGGWSLTFGLSNYYYLSYVADPEYNFPLALICVMVGFAGLSAGFFIPKAKSAGNYIASWLPTWEFKPEEIVIACLFFLGVGFCSSILALEAGQIGYQTAGAIIGETGSLSYFLTIIVPTSSFLLWVAFFRFKEWNFYHSVIAAAQVFTAVFMLLLLGGKSSLLQSLVLLIGAFVLVKRKIFFRHWAIFGVALSLCLIFGVIYGTKFRTVKGNNERISVEEYGTIAVEAVSKIPEDDLSRQLENSFVLLAERLEIVSALAVVVSNYEALSPYEESYGLQNNIWTYTWTAFIPRYLWKGKPLIADGNSYNELYFGHGNFGLTLTAMGDLLRNFGPIGVPLGMIVLGFGIRVFYASFVEGVPFSTGRSALYFIILTRISYDGFYGEILPMVIRVAAVILVQLFILKTIIYVLRGYNKT